MFLMPARLIHTADGFCGIVFFMPVEAVPVLGLGLTYFLLSEAEIYPYVRKFDVYAPRSGPVFTS